MKTMHKFLAAAGFAALTAGTAMAQDNAPAADNSLCTAPAKNGTQQQVLSEVSRFQLLAELTDTPMSFETYDYLGHSFTKVSIDGQTAALMTDNDKEQVCPVAIETFDRIKPFGHIPQR